MTKNHRSEGVHDRKLFTILESENKLLTGLTCPVSLRDVKIAAFSSHHLPSACLCPDLLLYNISYTGLESPQHPYFYLN